MDTQQSAAREDWHPADIKAALEKRGVSLRALAKEYGYSHIQRVLQGHWWAAEQIVAAALGVPAEQIWPSRYANSRDRGRRMTRNEAALRLVPVRAKSARKSAAKSQADRRKAA